MEKLNNSVSLQKLAIYFLKQKSENVQSGNYLYSGLTKEILLSKNGKTKVVAEVKDRIVYTCDNELLGLFKTVVPTEKLKVS